MMRSVNSRTAFATDDEAARPDGILAGSGSNPTHR